MKLLISDKLSPEGLSALKAHKELTIIEAAGKPREEIIKLVADVEGLIVRSETQVNKELIDAAKNLKVVGRAGVGVDNIDIPAATERGIVVMNAPEGNTIATCELTFAHLINSFRPVVNAAESMRAGLWDKKNLMGVELYGKTLGVLGLGRIGSQVAKRALAFGMKVLAYDPYLTAERAQSLGVTKTDLETILKSSDALTIHLPLTDETRNILNTERFAQAKKGIRIINCARGELIDLEALQKALENGQVSHAGLDVFPEEPLNADHPLRKNKKVSLTPHLGASTHEAQASVGVEIAESVASLLIDGQIRNALNAPSMSLSELERLKPMLVLAERLGLFVQGLSSSEVSSGQVVGKLIISIPSSYSGGISSQDITAISRAAMGGFLKKISGANMVNAPVVMQRLGINVEVRQNSDLADYSDSLQVSAEVKEGQGTVSATGALIGLHRHARLVRLGEVPLELSLSGRIILVIENGDVPGVVGHVGTVLAHSHINIANMSLGRTGKTALTLLELDSLPDEKTLAALRQSKGVLSAKIVSL